MEVKLMPWSKPTSVVLPGGRFYPTASEVTSGSYWRYINFGDLKHIKLLAMGYYCDDFGTRTVRMGFSFRMDLLTYRADLFNDTVQISACVSDREFLADTLYLNVRCADLNATTAPEYWFIQYKEWK